MKTGLISYSPGIDGTHVGYERQQRVISICDVWRLTSGLSHATCAWWNDVLFSMFMFSQLLSFDFYAADRRLAHFSINDSRNGLHPQKCCTEWGRTIVSEMLVVWLVLIGFQGAWRSKKWLLTRILGYSNRNESQHGAVLFISMITDTANVHPHTNADIFVVSQYCFPYITHRARFYSAAVSRFRGRIECCHKLTL